MVRLFDFVLPKESVCTVQTLYYRVATPSDSAVRCEENALVFSENSTVSFNTYFNCFPYSQYSQYTRVKTVSVLLEVRGAFVARLYLLSPSAGRKLLQERETEVSAGRLLEFDQSLEALPEGGILYAELTARSVGAVFYGGSYLAETDGAENPVRAAAVVCTYKRESFVYSNMSRVTEALYRDADSPIREKMDFFIVDNGNSIDQSKIGNKHIQVFPNKNWGGSGGFTRGMIEACREPGKYTHVLLMDDDITFETQSLVRTVGFLKTLKPAYAEYSLAAGMLERDRPYLQYGTGGVWSGRCGALLKSGLDLRETVSLLKDEAEEKADYSSWWYTCIPLSAVRKSGLPFPFFIKADDEEYGARTGRNFIFLSGAGVWHDSFSAKYNARLEYYIKRNEMIFNTLHFSAFGLWHNLAKLILALGKQALVYRFAGVDYLFAAYRDFLEGPDFFLRTDAEELNRQLSEMPKCTRAHPFFSMLAGFFRTAAKMFAGYGAASESYRSRLEELTSFEFWCSRLGIEPTGEQTPDETMKNGSVLLR